MTPRLSDPSLPNGAFANAEFIGQGSARYVRPLADAPDVVRRETSVVVVFAVGVLAATLGLLVAHVVVPRPHEEVVRVDTDAVVALVQDTETLGDLSSMNEPRDAVRRQGAFTDSNMAVSVTSNRALPLPASRVPDRVVGVESSDSAVVQSNHFHILPEGDR